MPQPIERIGKGLKMTSAQTITRIKAYAAIYNVDTTELDEMLLLKINRLAKANEWNLVDDLFKGVK